MFQKIKKLLPSSKKEIIEPEREKFNPPASNLVIIEERDLIFEDRVIAYLNKKNEPIDLDTGHLPDDTHWSEHPDYWKFARHIKVKSTIWPSKWKKIAGSMGVEVGTDGPQILRFTVPMDVRHFLLNGLGLVDDRHLFEINIRSRFANHISEMPGGSDGTVYVGYDGAVFKRSGRNILSICQELVVFGYCNFHFLMDQEEQG